MNELQIYQGRNVVRLQDVVEKDNYEYYRGYNIGENYDVSEHVICNVLVESRPCVEIADDNLEPLAVDSAIDVGSTTASSSCSSSQNFTFDNIMFGMPLPEPIPIHPSGRINVVSQIDLALQVSYGSSKMPESFVENLYEIFILPQGSGSAPHAQAVKKLQSSGEMATGLDSFPPPARGVGGLFRCSSAISASSTESSTLQVPLGCSDRWQERYEDLKRFVQKHGHRHIPINYKENIALSKWAKRQRYQWKLKQEGRPSSLTDDRKEKLDDIGFLWDVRSQVWETRFRELVQFKEKYGHCHVGVNCKEFSKLGTWVKCQRRQFCLMQKGLKSHMTQTRIEQLNSLGFSWKGKAHQCM